MERVATLPEMGTEKFFDALAPVMPREKLTGLFPVFSAKLQELINSIRTAK
jgi:hypothetical protein